MTIEATLSEIVSTLKAIHVQLASGAAVAAADAAAPSTATATADKPKNTKPTKAETAPPASAPTPPAEKAVDWKADVMPVLMEINKSTKPEHGRAGLVGLIKQFTGSDAKKVPDLEALGKHAEVLAAAKALLAGETTGADDDLGI